MVDLLFRITYKQYLLNMLDYFTMEELSSFKYQVVSVSVRCGSLLLDQAQKPGYIYPSFEAIEQLTDTGDTDLFRRTFTEELKKVKNDIYQAILQPIIQYHHNILIVYDDSEELYLDVIVDFLAKRYHLPCIDLNRLFTEGETDIFYLDRREIHNRSVRIAREATADLVRAKSSTFDGRMDLLYNHMSKKDKLDKLDSLGVKVDRADLDHLNDLLVEAWVNELVDE